MAVQEWVKPKPTKIIGKIYSKMGILSGDFKVKLTDLSRLCWSIRNETQKILDESKGCVLFIDEAYSIGSNDKRTLILKG